MINQKFGMAVGSLLLGLCVNCASAPDGADPNLGQSEQAITVSGSPVRHVVNGVAGNLVECPSNEVLVGFDYSTGSAVCSAAPFIYHNSAQGYGNCALRNVSPTACFSDKSYAAGFKGNGKLLCCGGLGTASYEDDIWAYSSNTYGTYVDIWNPGRGMMDEFKVCSGTNDVLVGWVQSSNTLYCSH